MDSMDPFMQQALAQARRAVGLSEPNPRVGCVIVSPDGRVLGEGHTQTAGEAHAEIMALRDAQAKGHAVTGAAAYVTLEPCSHHGRTGPCCDALAGAGIGKVVAALPDPNPLVGGQGFARLRAAGIEVDVGPGAAESRELNIGFFSRMVRQTPWVRMKVAASLDGKTALDNGASQWITSEAARADGHAWRARAGAVLTGIGTLLEDNPRLDVRHAQTAAPARRGGGGQPPARRPRLPTSSCPAGAFSSTPRWPTPSARPRWKRAAPRSSSCPGRAARSIWPPCCATWHGARSTNCTWKRATSSMAR